MASTGSYQKGFTKPELKAYLEDALGDGYTVRIANNFGKTAAIVTKDGGQKSVATKPVIPAKNTAKYSLRRNPEHLAGVNIADDLSLGKGTGGQDVHFTDLILRGIKP